MEGGSWGTHALCGMAQVPPEGDLNGRESQVLSCQVQRSRARSRDLPKAASEYTWYVSCREPTQGSSLSIQGIRRCLKPKPYLRGQSLRIVEGFRALRAVLDWKYQVRASDLDGQRHW